MTQIHTQIEIRTQIRVLDPRANPRSGFSLIEVMLAASLLSLLVTAVVGAWVYGQEATALGGARSRAVAVAEEGLEASRNIRDAAFVNLTDGSHGLAIASNQWQFSGTSDTVDQFTRQVNIAPVDANRKTVTSTATWQATPSRTGSVVLTTRMTNWRATSGGGPPAVSCAAYCQSVGYTTGTCRANPAACAASETYEAAGDPQCTGGADQDTCCCAS